MSITKRRLAEIESHESGRPFVSLDVNERAWGLYRQLQAQRAVLKTYADALAFVRVRQAETPEYIEPVAKKLWEIARTQ
jgi:hypothetical protein